MTPTPAEFAALAVSLALLGVVFAGAAVLLLRRPGHIWRTVWVLEAAMVAAFVGALLAFLLAMAGCAA